MNIIVHQTQCARALAAQLAAAPAAWAQVAMGQELSVVQWRALLAQTRVELTKTRADRPHFDARDALRLLRGQRSSSPALAECMLHHVVRSLVGVLGDTRGTRAPGSPPLDAPCLDFLRTVLEDSGALRLGEFTILFSAHVLDPPYD